ncbi:HAD-like domain-containing protein [Cynara cardunculus var. scolymus]|uniref:HAD-like domain-containing protein n=1 Tax=Cynara cardunculus var. scolymus TaxID=59895 RepID=A0A124SEH1_CYNCS|nr:HAD-like domain-containing protein [Cynara cardunculus var. scolymus]
MDRLSSSPRLMIVSDLDHTMVDHHDPENLSILRFNALWEAKYRQDSLLVFSTGRSPTLYKQLRREKPMLTPDITIMSVGTEITYGNDMVQDEGWIEFLNQKWDKQIVSEETSKFSELTMQLDIKIIYSGGMDLDILPKGAGKGQALAYLHKKLKEKGKLPKNTLACGDSGNDAELFTIPDVHGVIVKNAQEELLQWHAENAKNNPKIIHANERCAAGIIEAIGHFKLGPNISSRDVTDLSDAKLDHFDPAYEVVKFFLFYERWRRAEVENHEVYLSNLKSVCSPSGVFVHPLGVHQSLHVCIDKLKDCCGDKKEEQYRVWVDQVFPSQIDSDTWLVKFQKWEQTGQEQQGCLTTVVVSSKGVKPTEGLTWLHVHQTWMEGTTKNSRNDWFF